MQKRPLSVKEKKMSEGPKMSPHAQIVLDTSSEAATYVTNLSGWVSRTGLFYGDNEDSESCARYAGCTHRACQNCGAPTPKEYTICDTCREKKAVEHFNALPTQVVGPDDMVYSDTKDIYFQNLEEAEEYAHDNNCTMEDLRLLVCTKVYFRPIDTDYWAEDLPEDHDYPDSIWAAIYNFNALLTSTPTGAVEPTSFRVELSNNTYSE